MRTESYRGLAIAAGLLAMAGCAVGPEIRTDYDATVDFSRYATFAFMERPERGEMRGYDTISDRRIMAAVSRELEARGYRRIEHAPDLLVNFAITSEDVQDVRTVPATFGPYWYPWRTGFYHPWPYYGYETRVDRYERGTLFIDLVDAERRQLVWEGRAVSRVTRAAREDPGTALDNAISEIFARYPFRAGPQR